MADPATDTRWRRISLVVAGCLFILNLDSSIIATSLPQMAVSFSVRPVQLSIGISAYILAGAAVVPLSGWLAERIGGRRLLLIALALFTAASVACGAVQNFWPFVAARIVQGAGGAMMLPVGQTIVLHATDRSRMIAAIGLVTWPSLIAPVLGPALGGFITTYINWRWNFLLNLPLGIVLAVLVRLILPESASAERRVLDSKGLLLTSGAMVGLLAGLDLSSGAAARPALAALLVAASLALGVAAVRHLRRHRAPVLSLLPMRVASFAYSLAGPGIGFRMVFGAVPFLLPLMFQLAYHLTAASAGLLVLVYFSGNLLMKIFTTRIMQRVKFRTLLVANGILVAASVAWCGFLTPFTPRDVLTVALFAAGATRSLQFTALTTLGFADIEPAHKNDASTLSSLIVQGSVAGGIAICALLLNFSLGRHAGTGATPGDFHLVFGAFAAISLIGALGFLHMPRDTGSSLHSPA